MAYLTSAVGVVVLAVVLVHIMSFAVLLGWDHPHSLFGKGNYILNRYYSTHTMHVHKMNTYDIALKMLSNNGLSVDDIEKIYKPQTRCTGTHSVWSSPRQTKAHKYIATRSGEPR
jgi:hypothetical protein